MSHPGNRGSSDAHENQDLKRAQAFSEQNPQNAEGWNKLALLTAAAGDFQAAVLYHERAIALEPQSFGFHLDFGNTFAAMGQTARAIECYGKVLKLDPNAAAAWNNLGNIFLSLKDPDNAIVCYQTAARLEPNSSAFHYHLGRSLDVVGRHHEAMSSLVRALELDASHRDSWANLGNAFQHLGQFDKALSCFDRALSLSDSPSEQAEQHVNRAMILLGEGNFQQGWKEYEYRWDTRTFSAYKKRPWGRPQWRGEPITGKRILLHAEQGYGDAIQFARFIPSVVAQGAEVFLEVSEPIQSLLGSLIAPGHLLVRGESLPSFDYHCSLVSLPSVLDVGFQEIPSQPYLVLPPSALEEAQLALDQATIGRPGFRIGICWRGNSSHPWDRLRSLRPAQLCPLSKVSRVQWFSLQWDSTPAELAAFPDGLSVTPLLGQSRDFLPTAAFIQALDLVVSVDTVTAHLTGALGKPLWLLIPAFQDWRWHSCREDSPWYPAARLFRQQTPGSWTGAIQELAESLIAMTVASPR
jgi:tetratricopeptide (TPR) repeat protein